MALRRALLEYFGAEAGTGAVTGAGPGAGPYGLAYRETGAKAGLLGSSLSLEVDALLTLRGNSIDFEAAAQRLESTLAAAHAGKKLSRLTVRWVVSSDHGGIYLYEAIATKENTRRGLMRNRFIVVNDVDGVFSFGPGHAQNKPYSEAMATLIEDARRQPARIWKQQFAKLMDAALASMR
jgi:hypothetical protein